jgi:protein AFG1
MYGDVGTGKTMLMDMFFSTIPKHLTKKRIHFHAFMQDVHKRSHRLHLERGRDFDTAPTIAREISKEANVLCFDEFQVTDVADAMILRRLLALLYDGDHGVVTFMTSNREPDQLYINGVQRDSFIPCIEDIKQRNQVICLDSPTDYRKLERELAGSYFFPPPGKTLQDVRWQAEEHSQLWFNRFSENEIPEHNAMLEIWGRPLLVPKSVQGKVAQFTFNELCEKPLAAGDYLELTRVYPHFVITDIPTLSIRQTDVTRRFITFLDAAYESKTKMAVTAAKPFEHLFSSEVSQELAKNQLTLDDLADLDADADIFSDGTMFSGEEEKFAFARALSRLKQMSSKEWIEDEIL